MFILFCIITFGSHRNTYQLINKYKLYLNKEQEASKDHTKKCFWDTQAVKLSKTGVTEVWIYQFSNKSLWLNISSGSNLYLLYCFRKIFTMRSKKTGLHALRAFNNRRNKMRNNECNSSGSEGKKWN